MRGLIVFFEMELEILGSIKHRYLVNLWGYCNSPTSKLLIYDFLSGGSLDEALHDWQARLNVIMGAAKGLAYPHHDCCPRIIHRDIKSSNILLDGNFDARVSDFGLGKLLAHEESHITTIVAGTFVYLAPEYMQSGRATDKTDVYSFGVLLLEIVSGKWPTDASFIEKGFNIVGWYSRTWSTRSKKEVTGRLVTVNPCEGEHFYERLLLNNIRAPPSIQFLHTLQLGLLESDSYIYECLEEACLHQIVCSGFLRLYLSFVTPMTCSSMDYLRASSFS